MGLRARVGAAALATVLSFVAVQEGDGPTKVAPSGIKTHVAYKDAVGIPTICHGHTANVRMGQIATADQCRQWLLEDLDIANAAIDRAVTVDITDYERIALASFIYNVGEGNFRSSTMLKLINQGRFCDAAGQFPRWNKAKGRVLPGLTKRRAAERALFMEGRTCT